MVVLCIWKDSEIEFVLKLFKYSEPNSDIRNEYTYNIMRILRRDSEFMTKEQRDKLEEADQYLKNIKIATNRSMVELEKKLREYLKGRK